MSKKEVVRFTARFPEDLYEKLKISAEYNKRSVAKELEYIVEKLANSGELDNPMDKDNSK